MAQKVQILLTDDIDGSEASETISFALDGTTYEVDLNDKNAKKLRDALAPYVQAGRKSSGGRGGRGRAKSSSDYDPKTVRAWAESQGIDVPARGRMPKELVEQYRAANG